LASSSNRSGDGNEIDMNIGSSASISVWAMVVVMAMVETLVVTTIVK
jgi:hypothetical protein